MKSCTDALGQIGVPSLALWLDACQLPQPNLHGAAVIAPACK
jgi:hypothetical protein